MFLLAAACMISGALAYIFFGSADVQYYNDPDWREKKKAKEVLARKDAAKMARRKVDRRISALSNEI